LFEKLTALYIKDFFNEREDKGEGDEERQSDLQRALFDVTVDIEVTVMDPPFMERDDGGSGVENGGNKKKNGGGGSSRAVDDDADSDGSNDDRIRTLLLRTTPRRQETWFHNRSRRRKLEGKVAITYSQIISYRVRSNAEVDLSDLKLIVKEPFNNVSKRDKYVASLKDGGEGHFDALELATLPMIQGGEVVDAFGPDLVVDKSNKLLVGLGVVGLVIFAVLGTICCETRKPKIRCSECNLPHMSDTGTLNTNPNSGFMSEAEMASLPDQEQSVATIDHDYMYTSHRPCTASTAGGTLGTYKSSKTGAQSNGTNDASFIEYFLGGNFNRVKDVFDVIVPPGKVGVVFNTPDSGAPTIDSFREYCLISDQLAIGDQIIAVDDENVTEMTAVELSILNNQKSGNPTRKFTMLRKS